MEKFEELLQKLGAALIWQKAAGLAGIIVLVVAGYWYFFLSDIWTERDSLNAEQTKLTQEKTEYENRKKEYLAFRAEVKQLEEEQKDVLRLLPKKDDIEQFVEALQQQTELSGLNRATLIRDPPLAQDLFVRLPIKMGVYGTYHQLMRFFKNMGEIPRIVNIEDLRMSPAGGSDNKDLPPDTLKAEFTAVAFQYLDKGGPKKAGVPGDAGMKSVAQSSGGGK